MKLAIKIQPILIDSISVGTVEIIKLIREELNLDLAKAKAYIDRCVFDGETVLIPIPIGIDVERLLAKIRELETRPKIEAFLVKE
ncbi:MAG TPA: hypothetical protein PKE69_14965 [Pyrinomonadaceae bacterium]|mgnify:CR=1 FL=1|nr:hypothetical protein [Pyrinomonadaceae bacterium]